ncbi:MAG: Na+/H+ antiporter subunit G [Proteobacteria bacterium]|nr:Na+/H+ antiporter subunit G [Burkholderiales bacterium]
MLDLVSSALVIVGVFFTLVGSIGLVKLSDFMKRLHCPTKASTLGVGCVLIASMIDFSLAGETSLHELLISLFIFITAPVSAHLMVKAALRDDPNIPRP